MTMYLLSMHRDPAAPEPPPADAAAGWATIEALNEELRSSGAWVFGGALHGADTATVVRAVDGQVTTTDGPYVETREQLGGFYIVEAPDLDAALSWAAKTAAAIGRPIEVRPFADGEAA